MGMGLGSLGSLGSRSRGGPTGEPEDAQTHRHKEHVKSKDGQHWNSGESIHQYEGCTRAARKNKVGL